MSFLPEEDVDYLVSKTFAFTQLSEVPPGGGEARNALLLPTFHFEGDLFESIQGTLTRAIRCAVLILIPSGYSTTKLDSFYTSPYLRRANGAAPQNTADDQILFDRKWQFWSRHLDNNDWRAGIDGIATYLQYIRRELKNA